MSFFLNVSKHCRSYTEAHDEDMPVVTDHFGVARGQPVLARNDGQLPIACCDTLQVTP
jgi:ethanolamine utilization protein EutA (predicted chaperonin)